ncbi:CDP-diacylglycerol--glycerol-3-phosphate 3-phosphatidyltransferase [Thermodesulfobacteriota bacterium]
MRKQENKIFNLPNKLTTLRLLCIPLVVFFMFFPGKWLSFFAAVFIGAAFITDVLDGYFARKYDEVTALGKFLDPLADKILVAIVMIMLVRLERIPVLIVLIIISREMAITGLRAIAASEGVIIQSSKLGKFKTIFQAVAIIALTLHYEYYDVNMHSVGMVFLCIAFILTVWSGWDYLKQFNGLLFPENKNKE